MPRKLNRRQALASAGTLSLGAVLAACGSGGDDADPAVSATPRAASPELESEFDTAQTCELTAEQAEGPYYFDADAIRSDIREDRDGLPLRLGIRVRDAECAPIRDAVVDIWHCDAGGVYSGFDAGEGERFLRGTQVTDRAGVVEFRTIYPGFYPGRTVHIHAKVHLNRRDVLTTQLYFDEAVSSRVFESEPYASAGARDQTNESDGLFDPSLVLSLERLDDGYRGLINLNLA